MALPVTAVIGVEKNTEGAEALEVLEARANAGDALPQTIIHSIKDSLIEDGAASIRIKVNNLKTLLSLLTQPSKKAAINR